MSHVFEPRLFGGRGSKFRDINYQIDFTSYHVAKFHSDRRTDLEDL